MDDFEYELIDTKVFDEDRYFDVFVEYAKANPEDLLIQCPSTTAVPRPPACGCCPRSGSTARPRPDGTCSRVVSWGWTTSASSIGAPSFPRAAHWSRRTGRRGWPSTFHGDNGAGLGASHQTGWTGLVAPLRDLFGRLGAKAALATEKEALGDRIVVEQGNGVRPAKG